MVRIDARVDLSVPFSGHETRVTWVTRGLRRAIAVADETARVRNWPITVERDRSRIVDCDWSISYSYRYRSCSRARIKFARVRATYVFYASDGGDIADRSGRRHTRTRCIDSWRDVTLFVRYLFRSRASLLQPKKYIAVLFKLKNFRNKRGCKRRIAMVYPLNERPKSRRAFDNFCISQKTFRARKTRGLDHRTRTLSRYLDSSRPRCWQCRRRVSNAGTGPIPSDVSSYSHRSAILRNESHRVASESTSRACPTTVRIHMYATEMT